MPEVVVAKPARANSTRTPRAACAPQARFPLCFTAPGQNSVAVEVDPKQISRILFSETGHNTIFDVEVAGHPTAKAMIVDWQREPIKDRLIHIDLKRIALDKLLRVSVRVKLLGVPIGVKAEGGILDQVMREVEIECLPADIPGHLDVDVSELGMHQVLRVSGLPHSDKVKYLTPEDATWLTLFPSVRKWLRRPRRQKRRRLRVAAPAEGAAAPGEPEVTKKGKAETAEAAKKPEGGAKK